MGIDITALMGMVKLELGGLTGDASSLKEMSDLVAKTQGDNPTEALGAVKKTIEKGEKDLKKVLEVKKREFAKQPGALMKRSSTWLKPRSSTSARRDDHGDRDHRNHARGRRRPVRRIPRHRLEGLSHALRLRGERSMPRMIYLDGTVWLMSPSFPHERLKKRLGWFVDVIVEGLDIPCIPTGSTTFRRRAKTRRRGRRSDLLSGESRNAYRGKEKLHLKTDPPPDLAIEAVHSHEADAAVEVYRRFKVPEVWVCDEAELVILVLQSNGQYAESRHSASFPFLSAAEIYDWIQPARRPVTETEWIKGFRAWVRRTLKPRVRSNNQNPRLKIETNNTGLEIVR